MPRYPSVHPTTQGGPMNPLQEWLSSAYADVAVWLASPASNGFKGFGAFFLALFACSRWMGQQMQARDRMESNEVHATSHSADPAGRRWHPDLPSVRQRSIGCDPGSSAAEVGSATTSRAPCRNPAAHRLRCRWRAAQALTTQMDCGP